MREPKQDEFELIEGDEDKKSNESDGSIREEKNVNPEQQNGPLIEETKDRLALSENDSDSDVMEQAFLEVDKQLKVESSDYLFKSAN